jgi:bile acid-coenzyme A ligase
MAVVSYSQRLRDLAAAHPDRAAVVCGDETVTYPELVARIDDLAAELHGLGVRPGTMVTIALPNSVEWFVAFAAAWRLGATRSRCRAPRREIEAIMELADPSGDRRRRGSIAGRVCLPIGHRAPARDPQVDLPDVVSTEWKAPTSGGSTGRPKLIVSGDPAVMDTDVPSALLFGATGPMIMRTALPQRSPSSGVCRVCCGATAWSCCPASTPSRCSTRSSATGAPPCTSCPR